MKIYIERRGHKRFNYEALITHDISTDSSVHPGRMFNFSKGGLYFESDQKIYPGEDIFVALAGDADCSGKDTQLLFEVKILWHRKPADSPFCYGYGGRFLSSYDSFVESGKLKKAARQPSGIGDLKGANDSRKYRRRPYNKASHITYKNTESKGFIANISPGGAFILTKEKFDLGGMLELVIPDLKSTKEIQVTGWIVRRSPEGIGVSFERRSGRERRSDLDRRTGLERRSRKRRKTQS